MIVNTVNHIENFLFLWNIKLIYQMQIFETSHVQAISHIPGKIAIKFVNKTNELVKT